MQWNAPPPVRMARASTPTVRRPGKREARRVDGLVVVRRAVRGDDDRGVGHVEVHVARRHHAPLGVDDAPRRGHADDVEPVRAGVAQERAQHVAVRIVARPGFHRDDHAGPHEANDRVDVTVGVVVEQALAQPEHALDAEELAQQPLDLPLLARAVAVGVEQALAGGQGVAFPVDVDGAALEDPACRELPTADEARDVPRHLGVAGQDVLAAPAVEAEPDGRDLAAGAAREDGGGVAEPDVAEGHAVRAHVRAVEGGSRQAFLLPVGDQDFDPLAGRHEGDQAGEGSAGGGEIVLPEVGVAGPGHPGGLVRCPLGGHAETGASRRRHAAGYSRRRLV